MLVRLPSLVTTVANSFTVSSSYALASRTATLVETNVYESSINIDLRPSICINFAENTTGSVLSLRPIVSPSVLANYLVSCVATHEMVNSKKKAVSSDKSPRTRKKPSSIFGKGKLWLPLLAGGLKKVVTCAQNRFLWCRLLVSNKLDVLFCQALISVMPMTKKGY